MGRHLETVMRKLLDTSKLVVEIEGLKKELAATNIGKQKALMHLSNVKKESPNCWQNVTHGKLATRTS